MATTCGDPAHSLGLVRDLLVNVDCNVRYVTQSGYQAVAAPDSQLAFALTALMTIYVAVFGLRLVLGIAPLRVGDLTLTAIKLGVVLALATSWPTYQQLVFDTLFHGPEQIAASMMNAIQPPGAAWHGNPFIGLQAAYDQMQSSSDFFTRLPARTGPQQSNGGASFASMGLTVSSFLMLFATLGVVLMAKIVLGILLALGPLFVAFLLFDGTRGIFEGWLRAVAAFAFLPLFATLALVVQLTLVSPHLVALARMALTNQADLPAATSVLILTLVGAMVSLAGVIGLFIVAIGFKWPATSRAVQTAPQPGIAAPLPAEPGGQRNFQPRIVSVGAAAAALDRRDLRVEQAGVPRRFSLGPDAEPLRRAEAHNQYRRSARLRRSASSTRRDQ